MKNRISDTDKIYRDLQKHLDRMPVGFPASRSGADIKLLKHIFTPAEAIICTFLSYRPEPAPAILEKIRADHAKLNQLLTISAQSSSSSNTPQLSCADLENILTGIQNKGGIESRIKKGRREYCNSPLVVGIYEMQIERLTDTFLKDFSEYSGDINFGLEFLSLRRAQMRTIPIGKSIKTSMRVSPFDNIHSLLEKADPPFTVVECICRKKRAMSGESCKVTERKETCIAVGNTASTCLTMGIGREISREEVVAIIEMNQKQGLILQPSNTEKPEFICSCCGCCCGMLSIHKKLPVPADFWESNFQAAINYDRCVGCGACEKRCQVGAINLSGLPADRTHTQKSAIDSNSPEKSSRGRNSSNRKYKKASVNHDLCIGCGQCVTSCKAEAIRIIPGRHTLRPPKDREALHEEIMSGKEGVKGRIKVFGKLARGVIKTGRTELLKK